MSEPLPNLLIQLTPYLLERVLAGETVYRLVELRDGRVQAVAVRLTPDPLTQVGGFWVGTPAAIDAARALSAPPDEEGREPW